MEWSTATRLLSRQRAVGSAIVSNPDRETTSPTPCPRLGRAPQMLQSARVTSQQTALPQSDNTSNINCLCCLRRQMGVRVS